MMIFRILEIIEEKDDLKNINANEKTLSNRRWKEIVIAKKSKISQKKRPMDLYMFQEPENIIQSKKGENLR